MALDDHIRQGWLDLGLYQKDVAQRANANPMNSVLRIPFMALTFWLLDSTRKQFVYNQGFTDPLGANTEIDEQANEVRSGESNGWAVKCYQYRTHRWTTAHLLLGKRASVAKGKTIEDPSGLFQILEVPSSDSPKVARREPHVIKDRRRKSFLVHLLAS